MKIAIGIDWFPSHHHHHHTLGYRHILLEQEEWKSLKSEVPGGSVQSLPKKIACDIACVVPDKDVIPYVFLSVSDGEVIKAFLLC